MSEKPKNFNDTHPELQSEEVFFANVASERDQVFGHLPFTTKRLGLAAYSTSGQTLDDARPVFVGRSELEKRGSDPDKPF
jgi:hypothetical protein